MDKYLLGIDIGTTSTKLVLIHADGRIISNVSKSVNLYTKKTGWAEEDPMEWVENIQKLVPELIDSANIEAFQIASVGVSGMVPTLICLDRDGKPLRYSIQQNDARATEEIAELSKRLEEYHVLEKTGSAITQQSIAPKLMWLKKYEPSIIEQTASICGSYDFITRFLINGKKQTIEKNWALESGLYNLQTNDWDETILEAAGINKDWLGEVYESHEVVEEVGWGCQSGLEKGTSVVAGAADHVASAFSAGLFEEGDMLIKLGGAGDILISSSKPIFDERLFLDYHLVPGLYLPNGCMASSGSLIKWFQREIANGTPLTVLDKEAEQVKAGSDGLITLPYFLGEKTPINDTKAKGMFVGLHLGHSRAHIFRSILEGIGFGFQHHIQVFQEIGITPKRVRITNGGSKSRLWRTIISDITGLTLESIIEHPGSSLGAAFIAGMGIGAFDEWSEIEKFIKVEETITPSPENTKKYETLNKVYLELYPKLIKEQHILADFSSEV